MYKAKIIDKKTLECIKRLIFLRNLIAYEYYAITEKELREMAQLLSCLEKLINNIK